MHWNIKHTKKCDCTSNYKISLSALISIIHYFQPRNLKHKLIFVKNSRAVDFHTIPFARVIIRLSEYMVVECLLKKEIQ